MYDVPLHIYHQKIYTAVCSIYCSLLDIREAILFCLLTLMLCLNQHTRINPDLWAERMREGVNGIHTGPALLKSHQHRQKLKLLKLFSLTLQYLHTSLPYSHDCCKSEIIRRMLFIKFVLCSLSRMLAVEG